MSRIYVGGVDPHCSAPDIQEHLNGMGISVAGYDIKPLASTPERKSFCVSISENVANVALTSRKWPNNITVRPFRDPAPKGHLRQTNMLDRKNRPFRSNQRKAPRFHKKENKFHGRYDDRHSSRQSYYPHDRSNRYWDERNGNDHYYPIRNHWSSTSHPSDQEKWVNSDNYEYDSWSQYSLNQLLVYTEY